jgi:hypothetical protein
MVTGFSRPSRHERITTFGSRACLKAAHKLVGPGEEGGSDNVALKDISVPGAARTEGKGFGEGRQQGMLSS